MRSRVRSAALTVIVGEPLPKLTYSGTGRVIVEHEKYLGMEPWEVLVCTSFLFIIFSLRSFYMLQNLFPPHKIVINFISLCFVEENKLWFKSKLS